MWCVPRDDPETTPFELDKISGLTLAAGTDQFTGNRAGIGVVARNDPALDKAVGERLAPLEPNLAAGASGRCTGIG